LSNRQFPTVRNEPPKSDWSDAALTDSVLITHSTTTEVARSARITIEWGRITAVLVDGC
jgi:hypothetical protein